MKKIVKFLQISFFFSFLFFLNSEKSYAACNFGNLKIGDDVSKVEALYGMLAEGTTDGKIQVFPEDVCEGENLDDVIIEIAIYNNTISGFIFETEIADFETPPDEQNLYNYVVANYGLIEGSQNKNWTGSKTWQQGNKEIYYMKYDQFDILEEILLITTVEYRDSFVPSDDVGFEEPGDES